MDKVMMDSSKLYSKVNTPQLFSFVSTGGNPTVNEQNLSEKSDSYHEGESDRSTPHSFLCRGNYWAGRPVPCKTQSGVFRFLLVFALGLALKAVALTSGPVMPEYSDFEPVDVTDLVNLHNGKFTYNIPLATVEGPGLGFPLTLSYHSGITPNQEASWVGLGWNLQAGSINRQINKIPDDFNGQKIYEDIVSDKIWGWQWKVSLIVTFGISWNSLDGSGGIVGLSFSPKGSPISAGFETGFNGVFESQSRVTLGVGGLSVGINDNGLTAGVSSGLSPFIDLGLTAGISSKNGLFTSIGLGYSQISLSSSSGFSDSRKNSSTNNFSVQGNIMSNVTNSDFHIFQFGSWETWVEGIEANNYYGILYGDQNYMQCGGELGNCTNGRATLNDKYEYISFDSPIKSDIKLMSTTEDSYLVQSQGVNGVFQPFREEDGDYFLYNTLLQPRYEVDCGGLFGWDPFKCDREYNFNISSILEDSRDLHTRSDVYWRFLNDPAGAEYTNPLDRSSVSDVSHQSKKITPYFSDNGKIIGFDVINNNGVVYSYHYGLRNIVEIKSGASTNDVTSITKQVTPEYYYTWLLSSIKSPDYVGIDPSPERVCNTVKNSAGTDVELCEAMDLDIGGWVKFNYGDGETLNNREKYAWKSPFYRPDFSNFSPTSLIRAKYAPSSQSKTSVLHGGQYSLGRNSAHGIKEVSYLNSVETPTHKAEFIVSDRLDSYSNGEDFYEIIIPSDFYTFSWVNLQNTGTPIGPLTRLSLSFIPGKLETLDFEIKPGDIIFVEAAFEAFVRKRGDVDLVCFGDWFWDTYANKPVEYVVGDLDPVFLGKSDIPRDLESDLRIGERLVCSFWPSTNPENYKLSYVKIRVLKTFSPKLKRLDQIVVKNKVFDGKVVSAVNFEYDYSLTPSTPNSLAVPSNGKLTLKKVSIGATNYGPWLPPYEFEYSVNPPYQTPAPLSVGGEASWVPWEKYEWDRWGFRCPTCSDGFHDSESPDDVVAWNLDQIKLPSGSEVQVEYEHSDFKYIGSELYYKEEPFGTEQFETINEATLSVTSSEIEVVSNPPIPSPPIGFLANLRGYKFDFTSTVDDCFYPGSAHLFVRFEGLSGFETPIRILADNYFSSPIVRENSIFIETNTMDEPSKIFIRASGACASQATPTIVENLKITAVWNTNTPSREVELIQTQQNSEIELKTDMVVNNPYNWNVRELVFRIKASCDDCFSTVFTAFSILKAGPTFHPRVVDNTIEYRFEVTDYFFNEILPSFGKSLHEMFFLDGRIPLDNTVGTNHATWFFPLSHDKGQYTLQISAIIDDVSNLTVPGGGVRAKSVKLVDAVSSLSNTFVYTYYDGVTATLPPSYSSFYDGRHHQESGQQFFAGPASVTYEKVEVTNSNTEYGKRYYFLSPRLLPTTIENLAGPELPNDNLIEEHKFQTEISDYSSLWGKMWKIDEVVNINDSSENVVSSMISDFVVSENFLPQITAELSDNDLGPIVKTLPVNSNDGEADVFANTGVEKIRFGVNQNLASHVYFSDACRRQVESGKSAMQTCLEEGLRSNQVSYNYVTPFDHAKLIEVDDVKEKSMTYFYDFYSGVPLKSMRSTITNGDYVTEMIPAYTKYSPMKSGEFGITVTNSDAGFGKNMLTQTFATVNYHYPTGKQNLYSDENISNITSANITTWKPFGGEINSQTGEWVRPPAFRVFKDLNWNSTQGFLIPSLAGCQWNTSLYPQIDCVELNDPAWTLDKLVSKYDGFGRPIEISNAKGVLSTTHYGYGHSLPTAFAQNSKFDDIFYQSFEVPSEAGVIIDDVSPIRSKTGEKSLVVPGKSLRCFPIGDLDVQKKYIASAWYYDEFKGSDPDDTSVENQVTDATRPGIHLGSYEANNCSVETHPNSGIVHPGDAGAVPPILPYEMPPADPNRFDYKARSTGSKKWKKIWIELDLEKDCPDVTGPLTQSQVCVYASKGKDGSDVYYDELRVQPKNALMTTYTYDYRGKMTSTADVNQVVTNFEYDAFGNLTGIRNEEGELLSEQAKKHAETSFFVQDMSLYYPCLNTCGFIAEAVTIVYKNSFGKITEANPDEYTLELLESSDGSIVLIEGKQLLRIFKEGEVTIKATLNGEVIQFNVNVFDGIF